MSPNTHLLETSLQAIHLHLMKHKPHLKERQLARGHPLDASEGHERCERQPCAYLRVELAGIVQEGHADFLEAPDFTGVVLETLKHPAAHVPSAHKTVLDLSCGESKERAK